MPRQQSRLLPPLVLLMLLAIARAAHEIGRAGVGATEASPRYAYATLISGSRWILPARTLAYSLTVSGCKLPRVLMTTYSLSEAERSLMEEEGWLIRELSRIASPYGESGEKTRNTFSKILAFNLTEFAKLMFIDVDFLVLGNLDSAFECGDFCAASSARETQGRFNSGLQVITPNTSMFNEMVDGARQGRFTSYNGGDQGFLNEAVPSWCSNGAFSTWPQVVGKPGPPICRSLNENYNWLAGDGEVAGPIWWPPALTVRDLYPRSVLAVHYNHPVFWVVKPWVWWWHPLLPSSWAWRRMRLGVAGEQRRAVLLALGGIFVPLCSSAMIVWFGPAPFLLPFGRLSSFPKVADDGISPRLRRGICQNGALRAAALSICASLFAFLVLPSDGDALVAWTSYFTLKGFSVGLGALGLATDANSRVQDASTAALSLRRFRLLCTVRGYACGLIEAFIIWLPQNQGVNWLSDMQLYPLCANPLGSTSGWRIAPYTWWLFRSCNLTLVLMLLCMALLGLGLQLLALRPVWWDGPAPRLGKIIELGEAEKQV